MEEKDAVDAHLDTVYASASSKVHYSIYVSCTVYIIITTHCVNTSQLLVKTFVFDISLPEKYQ